MTTSALKAITDETARLVSGVRGDQHAHATPCPDYDVHALLNHLIGTNRYFAEVITRRSADPALLRPNVPAADAVTAYRDSAAAVISAWTDPASLDGDYVMVFGTIPARLAFALSHSENLVHGWDLSRGTSQHTNFDPAAVEITFTMFHGRIPDERRGPGKPYQAEVLVPADAPTLDRLVAYLGRQPSTA